jgi:hydrogen peroxide-dependent heme synthase
MPHDPPGPFSSSFPADAGSARGEIKTHAMQHGHRPAVSEQVPATLVPENGWHFLHVFYRVNRARLGELSAEDRQRGVEDFRRVLGAKTPGAPDQLQCFAVPGHKADFGIVMAGPDLRAIHDVQMAVQASSLGPALEPTYSFYSITEISEYVPDADAYARILREREKLDPDSSMFKAKVAAYAERLGPMNKQRLFPDFPNWPCLCFYPMSKMRSGDQNWYLLPLETRTEPI